MNRKSIVTALFAAGTLAVSGAIAATPEQAGAARPGMNMNRPGMPMQPGMMGGEAGKGGGSMMDMMGMMNTCQTMMGKGAMGGDSMHMKLPPGNEKLELQMHAEMMQKMGEIAGRYAEKIKDAK